jgi:hypothetical protein
VSTSAESTGRAGSIEVQGRQIKLIDHGEISATSSGSGDAGNIMIHAQDAFRSNNSSVTTQAETADGGNIHLAVGKHVDLFNSKITASVGGGEGKGGSITIDPTFVTLNHSQIAANAFGGPGGRVNIVADVFLASSDSSVTASSGNPNTPGIVNIQAAITNVSGLLEPLPENIFQATALLQQSCAARFSGGKLSSLAVGSRDGLPLEPGGLLPSPLYREKENVISSTDQRITGSQNSPLSALSTDLAKARLGPDAFNWDCSKQ